MSNFAIPGDLPLHLGQQSRNALEQTVFLNSLLCHCCCSCVTEGDCWISKMHFQHQLSDGYPKARTGTAAEWKCSLLPRQQKQLGVTVLEMGHRHFTAALCKLGLLWCTHTSLSTVVIMLCVCWPQRQAAVNLFQALWNLQYPDLKNKRDLENNEKWKEKQKGFYLVFWLCSSSIIANVLRTV